MRLSRSFPLQEHFHGKLFGTPGIPNHTRNDTRNPSVLRVKKFFEIRPGVFESRFCDALVRGVHIARTRERAVL